VQLPQCQRNLYKPAGCSSSSSSSSRPHIGAI
jgi:hypothetical protein